MTINVSNAAKKLAQWRTHTSQDNFIAINTIECHTGGEPLRIITDGFPKLKGKTILAKRRDCQQNHDKLRQALMFEPRGHADMYGAIIVDAERDTSHFGAIFIHNEGFSTMCGHAIIALTKCAVESGVVKQTGKLTNVVIDVPCGQIYAIAHATNEQNSQVITQVTFKCVPSFVLAQNQSIEVDGIGEVNFDIAFGGAFYAYVQAAPLDLQLIPAQQEKLIDYGRRIKTAVSNAMTIDHPTEQDLSFLYGVIFVDESPNTNVHSRNVCIFADGELDRSPTGSGVCGRIALHVDKKQVELNQSIVIESILASQFSVQAIEKVNFGGFDAIIPEVTGEAFIAGRAQWLIDPMDPLKNGFLLR
mgnify:CR=1 FL=1